VLAQMGIQRRLCRLVPPGRAALWLPLDDSLISGPEAGLRQPGAWLEHDVVDHLTAVLGFRGTLAACHGQLRDTPLIMNVSASTVRGEHTRKVRVGSVTDVVRAGAQAMAYHVNHSSPFEAEALRDLGRLVRRADSLGLPVVAIAYPRGRNPDGTDDNYVDLRERDEDEFARLVRHCVRLAVDLGASAVKTIFTGSDESFETVVASALGVPVLIAGERLVEEDEALAKAGAAIRAGAAGVAYGRQVFERGDPGAFVRKLRSILDREWPFRGAGSVTAQVDTEARLAEPALHGGPSLR
jgi:DhnA family fructose-bisphosphate aldolase class Ia